MFKRKLSVVLCVFLMTVFVFGACAKKNEDVKQTATEAATTSGAASSTEKSTGNTLPLTTKGETLSIAFPISATVKVDQTDPKLPVIAELEKRTGVVLKFQTEGTFEGYDTVMKTRLAAGADLPDLMMVPGLPAEYVESGLFLEIGGLMDKFAPNMKKWFEAENGAIKKLMTAPDKKIYTFPQILVSENGMARNAYSGRYILVRRDWMQKFNLQDPKNIDEFYTLLKFFRDNDPNGNGEKDEIPYTSSYGCLGLEGLGYLFDVHLTGMASPDGFYWNKDGKVVYQWIEQNFYELLKTAAKWYKEGLINPTPVQWNDWAKIQKALAGGVGCFELTGTAGVDFLNAEAKATDPNAWYEPLSPMESIYGNKTANPQSAAANNYWAITKNCANPELAIKFLDYAGYSDEGIMLQWHGVEGFHYNIVDGKVQLTDYIKNSKEGNQVHLDGALKGQFPTVVTRDIALSEQSAKGDKERELALENEKKIAPYLVKPFPVIMALSEEAKKINSIMPDIITYRDEMVVKVFLGELNIDDVWNEYVNKIKSMGIDEVIKIKEAQFARVQ